jgi:hypothetical protein
MPASAASLAHSVSSCLGRTWPGLESSVVASEGQGTEPVDEVDEVSLPW